MKSVRQMSAFAFIFFFTLWSWPIEAQERFFGMELAVTSDAILEGAPAPTSEDDDTTTKEGLELQKRLSEHIKKICGECRIRKTLDKWQLPMYVVTFPDGWWMGLTLDPDVIEIIGDAISNRSHEVMIPRLQTFVFDAAETMGLKPQWEHGGGHIHIDIKSGFNFNPVLFRNFIVDMFNHPEFAVQVFETDILNNPSIMDRKVRERAALGKVLEEFDRKAKAYEEATPKQRQRIGMDLILWLSEEIERQVYKSTTVRNWDPKKSQALSFRRITNPKLKPEQWTIELRGFHTQKSAREFFVLIEMLSRRIEFLKHRGGLIEFHEFNYKKATTRRKSERLVQFLDEVQINPSEIKAAIDSKFNVAFPRRKKWPELFTPQSQFSLVKAGLCSGLLAN